jgi:hypothetical protein
MVLNKKMERLNRSLYLALKKKWNGYIVLVTRSLKNGTVTSLLLQILS